MPGTAKFAFYARWLRVLVICLLVLAAIPALAEWRISDFRSTINLDHQGRAAVSEHITLVFSGVYHGIYRDIPLEYPGPHGTNFSLFLKVTGVTDGAGNK